jgi:RHS repeat-associated protein
MVMPGRKYPAASGVYRYGFNGKENDNEVKGEGNQQDYGMRIYDPRLMRFLSVDPISNDYPELTPYQFASNRPIDGIDQDGLEYAKANMHSDATIVRHNSDPHIAQEQIIAAPQRRNAVIAQDVQRKINTQARSVLTKYKEPDVAQKQRNASLQKNHDAKTVPENHWTRNKHLNNLSERVAEPMAEMAVGEGLGKVAAKGISVLMKSGSSEGIGTAYRAINPSYAESTVKNGFYRSGFPGRLGNDGIYANTTIEGAIKEFSFHNPNVKPIVFEVKYPMSKPLNISPPSSTYFAGPMPFTEGANILAAPSIRQPNTMNLLIRQGAQVGARIKTP